MQFPSEAGAIEVFTTRPDTLFGATFMVVAPEHPMVDLLASGAWATDVPTSWTGGAATPRDAVESYRRATELRTDLERQTEGRDKTGVFTGGYATNPVNGEAVPVFVADYVLMGYGTGAIMAVPGQDERDWEFAEALRAADRAHRRRRPRAGRARPLSARDRRSTRPTTRSAWTGWA